MTLKEFTKLTIITQLVELEDSKSSKIIFIGTVEKLEKNKELLEREVYFFTSFEFPNRICIRLK